VALFILAIACINFVNLSTARSANRAREVGLRKVFGAYKTNLVNQFLSESLLFVLIGMILSLILVFFALPYFNEIAGKEITFRYLFNPLVLLLMCGLILFAGFIAGSYPAFFLSAFQPIVVLRGVLSRGSGSSIFRKLLVMLQFSISIALIVGTFIVVDQINFMKDRNLGFNKEQVMVVSVREQSTWRNYRSVKQELMRNPRIVNASFSTFVPGRMGEMRLVVPEGRDQTESSSVMVMRPDHDFAETYNMTMASGRFFSEDFPADTSKFVINETAAESYGWTTEEAVGKELQVIGGLQGRVIGVVRDFHFTTLQQEINPVVMILTRGPSNFVSLKISTEAVSGTIDFINNKWSEYEPAREFNYFFIDDAFAAMYMSEELLSELLTLFAFFAVVVACLGLFGLASFTAQQRTKEIGMRKVLGASVFNIVIQLSKEFTKWVVLANLVAWPVSWYFMNNWLQNFAYRTSIGIVPFIVSGVLALVIALLTVGYQAVRAAKSNPVESLRYE